MPNSYFRFKQFTVNHDRCAMKVGTDGVLLGAWCNTDNALTALDIGTGTGLIALMLAQRNQILTADAIDIDCEAVVQAADNFGGSPFSSRLKVFNSRLQSYTEHCGKRYDIVVSNPPFFANSLKSPDGCRSAARHTDSLSAEELIRLSSGLLVDRGRLSVIYPFGYKSLLMGLAVQNNLFVSRVTNVYPTPHAAPKRVLMEFSKEEIREEESDLILETARHVYSDEFGEMVRDFYLERVM